MHMQQQRACADHPPGLLADLPAHSPLLLLLLLQVIEKEGITCSDDGLEAIVFTADGDMRQALNNLQVSLLRLLLRLLLLAGGDDVHACS
jgi:hypothetical protein